MARITAQEVEMPLAPGVLSRLGDIQDAGGKVAERCKESLDGEVRQFCNQVAKYLGESTRKDLEEQQNKESFNNRLLNTHDYFRLIPRVLDALVASQNMRKRAVDTLANAYADAFFEIAFAGLEFLRKAKHKQIKPEQMKELQKEFITDFEHEQIGHAVSSFKSKVLGKLERTATELKRLTDTVAGLSKKIQSLENKIEKQRAYFAECRKVEKAIPPEQIAECMKKSEQAFELRIKRMEQESLMVSTRASNDMLEGLKSRFAELSSESGQNLAEKWSKLFGPDGEGGKFVEQARKDCDHQLEMLADTKKMEIDRLEQALLELPDDWQAPLTGYITRMRNAQERIILQNENFDKALLDLAKNSTGQLVQKLTKAQELEQQQKQNTNTGSWYDSFWNWVDSIKNWVVEKINQWIPGIIVGMCSVVISLGLSILAWLASCFMWVMNLAAWLTQNLGDRTVTYIGSEFRAAGQKEAIAKGLPESFFSSAEQAEIIKGMSQQTDPDNIPDSVKEKSGKKSLQDSLKSDTSAKTENEANQQKNEVYKLVITLCRNSLDGKRIGESMLGAGRAKAFDAVSTYNHVTKMMDFYGRQFEKGEKGFFDFAREMWNDLWSSDEWTWPDIANYLNLIGSQLTLAARLVAAGLLVFVVTTPLAVWIFAVAEGVDIIAVAVRILICLVGTLPCVNAFGHDLMAILAMAYKAMIEEQSEIPVPEALAKATPLGK